MTTITRDLYQDITDKIITALEAGTAPWVRPWATAGKAGGMPHNPISGTQYRGINPALLMMAELANGYSTAQWVTYRQAQEAGAQVRKGEHGETVIFWKWLDVPTDGAADDDTETTRRCILKHYTVFNLDQIDGADLDHLRQPVATHTWTPDQRADGAITGTRADIRPGGERAYFRPELDYIQLPPRDRFPTAATYYGTALHELAHWTGHSTRLARDLKNRFGSDAYAAEELVAEIASAYTCAALGITGDLQHAEYIGAWLRILKGDKRAIFTAAAAAQKATDLLLAYDPASREALPIAA